VLDYSIRTTRALSYYLGFMIELVEEVPSSIISESRSCVQFSLAT
jgi:hypothetical protein